MYVQRSFYRFFTVPRAQNNFAHAAKINTEICRTERAEKTERKISIARSLFYKKRVLFCDPYRICEKEGVCV